MRRCIPAISGLLILLGACSVGRRHTADLKLERYFAAHETEFTRLLGEVQADSGLEMVAGGVIRYRGQELSESENPIIGVDSGLTQERWRMYDQQIRSLGLTQVTKNGRVVEFRVQSGSLANGDSYKGYLYSPDPPIGHPKESLDDYRLSDADRDRFGNVLVHKRIEGNWYLYLFINGARLNN